MGVDREQAIRAAVDELVCTVLHELLDKDWEAFRAGYERGMGAGKLSGNEAFGDLEHHYQQWRIESGQT